jgi:hypothetical protein
LARCKARSAALSTNVAAAALADHRSNSGANVTIRSSIAASMLVLAFAAVSAHAAESVGDAASSAAKKTGHAVAQSGRDVGHATAEAGRKTGHAVHKETSKAKSAAKSASAS